jgi:hypothetical protein
VHVSVVGGYCGADLAALSICPHDKVISGMLRPQECIRTTSDERCGVFFFPKSGRHFMFAQEFKDAPAAKLVEPYKFEPNVE